MKRFTRIGQAPRLPSGTCCGAMALTVGTFQVIGRYVNKNFVSIDGEEVVVYLTVWAVFLASSQLVRSNGHVRPDVILRLLPPEGQKPDAVFRGLVSAAPVACARFGILATFR